LEKATPATKKIILRERLCFGDFSTKVNIYLEAAVKRFLQILCLATLVCLAGTSLFADASVSQFDNASTDLLAADVPIQYGDASFRERILERTKGERSPVGLVLSGGSARAFAHIGVLKYLEEQGIVPDFIISNSMGSIVGLLYAAGMSPDQILESVSGVSLQSLFDLTFPVSGGILDPSRFTSKIASILGPDLQLQDLDIPIMVITEDLATKRQVQICEGDFYTVLSAAYALPVYFSPVEYNGHLLVDGGVTNIVPLDLAYEYADSVIVSTTFYDVDTLNLRNPLTVLNVTLDIGKRRSGVTQLKEHLDDVVWIRCAVEDVSFMDFGAVEELSAKGYDSAKEEHDKLASLYKGKELMDEQDTESQRQMDLRIEDAETNYRLFSHVRQYDSSQILGIGLDSEYTFPDHSYLKDDTATGVTYTFRDGDFETVGLAGVSFQSFSNDRMSINPTLNATARYYLLDHLESTLAGSLIYDLATGSTVAYGRETAEARFRFFDEKLAISLGQGFEAVSNPDNSDILEYWDGNHFLFHTTVSAGYLPTSTVGGWTVSKLELELGYQLLGDFSSTRPFASVTGRIGFVRNDTGIFADIFSLSRFALDGEGDVPLYLADQFRTNDETIRSQGHDLSESTNDYNYLAVLSAKVGYRPIGFLPSFGELFILENSSIATYFDFLWNDEAFGGMPYVSIGLELHTDFSLIGIRKLPVTVYAGWDQPCNSLIWGILLDYSF
jgi:NTE family protein